MRYSSKKLQFLWFFVLLILTVYLEIEKIHIYMTRILIGEFMKFKPLHDRVLIEVLDSSEKTAGGIIIPDTAQEKPQEGKVIAVGGGAKTEDGKIIPMDVKVGDKVLFGKWSGTEVKINGKEYSIMKESDIMGISSK
jgi:Co-chaperonin GroES (HSP10)